MDLLLCFTVFGFLQHTAVCQNPIHNSQAYERPRECAEPNCDCCITRKCHTCKGNCIEGIFGEKCRNQCPDRCVSCQNHEEALFNPDYHGYSNCTECKPGFYSTNEYYQCNYACSEGCASCLSPTQCTTCKTGYFLELSTSKYGYCTACPKTCAACLALAYCSDCKTGFEGNICQNCMAGFYGENCNQKCSDTCLDNICERTSGKCLECKPNLTGATCDQCVSGRYGQSCELACSANCRNTQCGRSSGVCTNGCLEKFTGERCDTCVSGKHGSECTRDCPVNCAGGTCDRNTGFCNRCKSTFKGPTCEGCKDGLYGSECTLPCPSNCIVHLCKRQRGECVVCKDGSYGQHCNNSCSVNCIGSKCNDNGVCDHGCKAGFSGDRCCIQGGNCKECSSNDNCAKCIDGKYGLTCEKDCPANCDFGTCNKADGDCPEPSDLVPVGAIVGGTIAAIVVISLVVVFIIWLGKRRQSHKQQNIVKTETYYNAQEGTIEDAADLAKSSKFSKFVRHREEEGTERKTDESVENKPKDTVPVSDYNSLDEQKKEETTYEEI